MFIWRLCHWSSANWKPAVARRHTRGVIAHDTETNCVFRQCPGTVRAVSRRAAPWLEPGKPPAKMPGRRLGHVYRAEQLLSLSCKQAIDANPETTQIYLHCADEPFRDIPIFKLESFTDPPPPQQFLPRHTFLLPATLWMARALIHMTSALPFSTLHPFSVAQRLRGCNP